MASDLMSAMAISSHGMKAQGARIKIISENVANSDTTSLTPGGDPYTRKTITFKNILDRETKTRQVQVDKIKQENKEPFALKYIPDSPGANASGMVKMPNVNSLVELMDMREAQRSYEANLGMMEQDRNMIGATIDLLRH